MKAILQRIGKSNINRKKERKYGTKIMQCCHSRTHKSLCKVPKRKQFIVNEFQAKNKYKKRGDNKKKNKSPYNNKKTVTY